ncbi:MAG: tRNA adenosine(34) deaminase TadA [Candidatus Krumholzibacteria bacterium]|nr:tRNA adenosine(34) deaminase TadA [Candidatus Krumholzibacteria bacterium]
MHDDAYWMGKAIEEARRAFDAGEVPVGAVVVHRDRIVGRGHNRTEETGRPFEHAEVLAMWEAVGNLQRKTLENCILYSTVEPCVMCVGAAMLARIPRIVFGALEPKTGACESVFSIPNEPGLDHPIVVTGGVEAEQALALMQAFFRDRRESS